MGGREESSIDEGDGVWGASRWMGIVVLCEGDGGRRVGSTLFEGDGIWPRWGLCFGILEEKETEGGVRLAIDEGDGGWGGTTTCGGSECPVGGGDGQSVGSVLFERDDG